MIDDTHHAEVDHANPEAVLAGTLCLMSCFTNHHCPQIAQKISHNLAVIAFQPSVSVEFKRLCNQLILHWDGLATRMAPGIAPRAGLDYSVPTGVRLH